MKRLLLCALLGACNPTSEDAFIQDRNEDACAQAVPACSGLYASCTLDDRRFARHNFPGAFRFMVEADPESHIEVQIYLAEQRDAGIETLIYWNEPGCSDVYVYDSEGRNLFEEAEETNVIIKKEKIYEGGQHLIEIISDMQARTVISVNVIEPES